MDIMHQDDIAGLKIVEDGLDGGLYVFCLPVFGIQGPENQWLVDQLGCGFVISASRRANHPGASADGSLHPLVGGCNLIFDILFT